MTPWLFSDGSRAEAGYKGATGDCVCRAIAIATGQIYEEVYSVLNEAGKEERLSKRRKATSSARTGVHRPTILKYMESLGWQWTSTMQIGFGCTVHLRPDELPQGRLVVSLSRHVVAVIDGVAYDTHDQRRPALRLWVLPQGLVRTPAPGAGERINNVHLEMLLLRLHSSGHERGRRGDGRFRPLPDQPRPSDYLHPAGSLSPRQHSRHRLLNGTSLTQHTPQTHSTDSRRNANADNR